MQANIYVIDYGVSLATGNKVESLLHATMARLPLVKADPATPLLKPGDDASHLPVQLSCFDDPELLWEAANNHLSSHLNSDIGLLLLLPDPSEPQAEDIFQGLSETLAAPGVITAYPSELSTKFDQALTSLQQGEIDTLTLVGVDSMVNYSVMTEWLTSGQLRTQLYPDGRAVGEGMGWFTLSLQPGDTGEAIEFHSGTWADEPVQERTTEFQGLALSLLPLIQSGLLTEPDTWVYSRLQTPSDTLQAFMGFQYHWGNQNFKKLEQLCPARQIGDLGVAAWPVAMALACERLSFAAYPKQQVLVSDSRPDGKHFSALLIANKEV